MANPVRPSEIIDIEGLKQALVDLKAANKDYGDNAEKMLDGLAKRVAAYKKEIEDLVRALSGKNPSSDFTETAKGLKDYTSALSGLVAAQERLKKSIDLSNASVDELKQRQKDLTKVTTSLKTETNANTDEIQEYEKQLKDTSAAVNQLTSTLKTASKQVKTASGSYQELQQSLTNDVIALKKLEGAFSTTNGKIDVNKAKTKELKAAIKQKQDALKEFDKQMGFNQRNVGNYSSAMSFLVGGVRGAIGSFGTWGIAIIAVGEALRGLNSLVLMGEQLRRSQIGVENVSSSALDAGINLDFLRDIAERLGLEIEGLNKSFKMFAGATQGTAFEGAKTRDIFIGITNAAAAMQLTTDETGSVVRAFSQMLSKQTVNSEELKQQLGEHLPSAMRIFAAATGKTIPELMKLMEQNKVLAFDVLPDVAEKLNEVYGQTALKNVDTLTGATAKLSNAWRELLSEDTSPIRSFLIWFYDKVTFTLNAIKDFGKSSGDMAGEKSRKNKQVFLSTFASGDRGDRENQIRLENEDLNSKLRQYKKLSQVDKLEKAKAIQEQIIFRDAMVRLNKDETDRELELKKKSADAKAKVDQEAAEKQAKLDEKAANQKLINDRKQYQIELRENQANEKNTLGMLEVSMLKGLITEQQYNDQRYQIADAFTNQRITLTDKYIKLNGKLEEELRDDEARNNADLQQNQIEFLKLKASQLRDYYKQIKDDLINSFTGIKGSIQADISQSESGNRGAVNVDRISLEKEKIKNSYNLFGQDKASNATQMELKSLGLDLKETQMNLNNLFGIYKDYYGKLDESKKLAIAKIDASDATELEKENQRRDIRLEHDKRYNDLSTDYKDKSADKQKEIANILTDVELAKMDEVAQRQKELFDKRMEMLEGGLQIATQIEQSINQVLDAQSDNRMRKLEKQKEYELSLAGDNAEAKKAIEANYQKKMDEERKKRDKREKMSTIFEIILNNQLAKVKALASGNIAQLFLAGIMGQIALATAIATPLPEYAKGKRKGDSYEGLAVVGEKGSEIVERDGKMTLADKATVTYVDPKTRVYTASETRNILKNRYTENISKEMDYNSKYLKGSSRVEQMKMAFNSTFKSNDLSLLKTSLSSGIEDGFEKANITINNTDGSSARYRKGSRITDITKRTYAR
jgi:tape measure domain-containing protein